MWYGSLGLVGRFIAILVELEPKCGMAIAVLAIWYIATSMIVHNVFHKDILIWYTSSLLICVILRLKLHSL